MNTLSEAIHAVSDAEQASRLSNKDDATAMEVIQAEIQRAGLTWDEAAMSNWILSEGARVKLSALLGEEVGNV